MGDVVALGFATPREEAEHIAAAASDLRGVAIRDGEGERGISWSDQSFSIAQRQWKDVRQNCEFFGTNSHAALGKRCDRGLLDDIETPDTARTPDMRDKLLEWVRIGPLTAPRPLWPRDKLGRVLIPACFGKTTIVMTRVLPVVELCDNPNVRLQFVGKNETEGFSFSSSIRQELLNPKLREDFGDFKPADRGISWSDQSFSIAKAVGISLRCRSDLEANLFWNALGFSLVRIFKEGTRNHMGWKASYDILYVYKKNTFRCTRTYYL